MTEDNLSAAALTAIVAKEITKEVYTDAVKPTAQVVGQAIAGPAKLLLFSFRLMGSAADIFLEKGNHWLEEKLKHVPPEDQIAPKPNLAVPIMNNLLYNMDEDELKDGFLNLLANAMSKDSAAAVHQAFPHILMQMSPNDAIFFKELHQKCRTSVPIASISIKSPQNKGLIPVFTHLTSSEFISDIKQLAYCIDNLLRLRLANIDYTRSLVMSGVYDAIESHKYVQDLKADLERTSPDTEIIFEKGILTITSLGKQFSQVALQPPQPKLIPSP